MPCQRIQEGLRRLDMLDHLAGIDEVENLPVSRGPAAQKRTVDRYAEPLASRLGIARWIDAAGVETQHPPGEIRRERNAAADIDHRRHVRAPGAMQRLGHRCQPGSRLHIEAQIVGEAVVVGVIGPDKRMREQAVTRAAPVKCRPGRRAGR
jgi:hypothetical protein